jgi:hypothetical protein
MAIALRSGAGFSSCGGFPIRMFVCKPKMARLQTARRMKEIAEKQSSKITLGEAWTSFLYAWRRSTTA